MDDDERIKDGKTIWLKYKPPMVLVFNVVLIMVVFLAVGLKKLVFNKAQINQDLKKIRQEFDLGDREQVITKLLAEIKVAASQEKFRKCLVLADEYRSLAQFDPAIKIVKEAIYAAQDLNDAQKKSKGYCYLGDIVRESLLFTILFSPQGRISDKRLEKAINYYEQADAFADQAKDPSLKAYALKGIGETHKLHYAANQMVEYFQKSINILDRKQSLTPQEGADLASMYMDIALAYTSGNIEFDKSLLYVKKSHEILTSLQTPLHNQPQQRAIFLKKYDLLLQNIHRAGYQSSSFYKNFRELKEEL